MKVVACDGKAAGVNNPLGGSTGGGGGVRDTA